MTLYANGIKVCPTIKVGGGDIDHGGAYYIKVIDYDGKILKQDHLDTGATFELPEPPTNGRLTFQTWSSPLQITNNTITVGKSDVTIGAVYTTKSGLNEMELEVTPTTGLTVSLRLNNVNPLPDVDWGDGNVETPSSRFPTHTYSDYGTYFVKCSTSFISADANTNIMIKGLNCTGLAYTNNVFYYLYYFTISNNATSDVGNFTVRGYCYDTVIMPPSMTSYTNTNFIFFRENILKNAVIPYGMTSFSSKPIFDKYCVALEKVTFPSTLTTIYQLFNYDSTTYGTWAIKELNFTEHTTVPTLSNLNEFKNPHLKIRVPKSLESQWKSATNWSAYADYIVGVE